MTPVPALNVRDLGDFIRDQRRSAQISLRQLAKQAGVSNPYLSQIERGLRKPSAEILQQIAKALRISAEVLYVQAGILEEREGGENVHAAVLGDEALTARQKQVILDIYEAFRGENAAAAATGEVPDVAARPTPVESVTATRNGTTAPTGRPPAGTANGTAPKPTSATATPAGATGTGTAAKKATVAGDSGAAGDAASTRSRATSARRPRAASTSSTAKGTTAKGATSKAPGKAPADGGKRAAAAKPGTSAGPGPSAGPTSGGAS